MANVNAGKMKFGVTFDVDKSSLNQIRSSLQDIQKLGTKDLVNIDTSKARSELTDIKNTASQVETALIKAFNPKLDSVNVTKFNQLLSKTGLNLNDIYQSFSKAGAVGQTAFTNLSTSILTTNVKLKESQSLIDKMGETLVNTVKWNVASSVINGFTGSIQNAVNYVKVLDSSLNDIRIVTGSSTELMDKFATSANQAAEALGRQTKDYTNAALTFYQQGLSDDDVTARTEATLKASNITGEAVDEMADHLTAVWNGYQISQDQTEKTVSKLAAVADTSASDMSELATAMSKTASVANNMGVTIDQLAAQIATITQVTRQAPETTGNALKTIYSRINDIKTGADGAEVSLGNYSKKMKEVGVNVLDANGRMRDTGDIMTEIGQRWGTMTKEQQTYLASTMAGQRQMNNLIALFDNWDTYTNELNTSLSANNELNLKNDIYMQSMTAHLNQLTAANEGLIQSLSDTGAMNSLIDAGRDILKLLTLIIDSAGNGVNSILAIGSTLTGLFSKQIGKEINSFVTNIQNGIDNVKQLKTLTDNTASFASINGIEDNGAVSKMITAQKLISRYYSVMTELQINQYNELVKNLGLTEQQKNNLQAQVKEVENFNTALTGVVAKQKLLSSSDGVAGLNFAAKLIELRDLLEKTQTAFTSFKKAMSDTSGNSDPAARLTELKEEAQNLYNTFDKNNVPEGLIKFKQLIDSFDVSTGNIYKLQGAWKNLQDSLNSQIVAGENLNKTSEEIDLLDQKTKNYITTLEQMKNSAAQAFDIQSLVKGVSAVGQLLSASQAFGNIGSIFSDKTLSDTEKFQKIATNLFTVTIPLGISAFTQIRKVGSETLGRLVKSTLLAEIETTRKNGLDEIQNDLAAKNITLEQAQARSREINTTAAKAEAVAIRGVGTALGIVAIAVTAAIAAYQAYRQHIEEANQAIIDEKNKTILANKEKQQLIEQNRDLQKSYLLVYQQYKDGTASKLDMDAAADALSDTLDKEALAVAKLTGNYDSLTDSIKKSTDASLDQIKASAQSSQAKLDQSAKATFENAGGNEFSIGGVSGKGEASGRYIGSMYVDPGVIVDSASRKVWDAVLKNIDTSFQDVQNGGVYIGLKDYSSESIVQLYNDLNNLIGNLSDDVANSDAAQSLKEYRDKLEEYVNQANDVSDTIEDVDLTKKAEQLFADVTSIDQFNQKRDELITFLKSQPQNLGKTSDELGELADQYIDNISDLISDLSDTSRVINSIALKMKYSYQQEAKKELSGLSDDELKILATVDIDKTTSLDSLRTYIKDAKEEAQKEVINATTDLTDQVSDIVQKAHDQRQTDSKNGNPKVTKGKSYTKLDKDTISSLTDSLDEETINKIGLDRLALLNSQNASLKEQYEVLQEIREITTQQNLDAATSATEDVKNTIEEQKNIITDKITALQEEKQQLEDAITRGVNENTLERYEEQISAITSQIEDLQEYLNTHDFTIDIRADVDTNLLDYFEGQVQNIKEDTNLLAQAASLVGEGYKVAADDVGALADIFPNILQNAQVLADGTMQLDKQVVEQVLGGEQAIVQQDTETTNQRLKNQVSMLDAEIAYCDSRLQIYQDLIDGKITEQQAQDRLNKAEAEFGEKMANAAGKSWTEAQNSATDNNAENANTVIGNLDLIGRTASAVSQVMAAALAGKAADYNKPGGGTKGSSGKSYVDKKNVNAYAATNDVSAKQASERIKEIQDEMAATQNEKDSAESLRNKYLELISKNTANTADAVKKSDYARQGLGGSYNPESTKNKSKSKKGSSAKLPKSADEVLTKQDKEQIDRYHELDRVIKELTDTINHLSKAEDKTIRNGTVKMIDKEIAGLQQEVALYNKKHLMVLEDIKTQAGVVKGLGAQLDAQGNIVNYYQLLTKWQDAYNARIQKAAQMTDKAQQDAELKAAEIDKKNYDSWKKTIENYESLQDTLRDVEDQLQDIADQEEELRIKQFKIKVDVELDINQARRDWNDFQKEVVKQIQDDDYLGQANAAITNFSTYYNEKGTGDVQALTERINQIRKEAQIIENGGTSSIYGQNEKQALEDLKSDLDQLYSSMKDVVDLRKEVKDAYLNQIDQAKEEFDQQITTYEQIDSLIEHDINMLNLLHPRNDDYDALDKWYKKRSENYNQEIDFYRKEANMWKAQMDNAKKGSDEWKKFRDNWMDSISGLNEAVEAATKNLIEKYQNTVTKIMKQTKDSVAGGDWDKALSEWDKRKWQDDRYLDIASRATGVLDFQDAVNDAMKNQSPKVQKQLADFLDKEINDLNSITNLRQIDLDIANKKLAVIQKQIALEDVQNAKTTMRLRRDSQGNYTYQYVADEDQTQTKQKELRDAVEELRLLVKNDLTDTMDEAYQKMDEYFEKATEIANEYYDDQELMKLKLHDLEEEYFGEDGYITLLDADYIRSQGDLVEATGAELDVLYAEQGDKLKSFLGLDNDAEGDSIWGSILQLISADGTSGKIPDLLNNFTNGTYTTNFQNMDDISKNFLFGDTGLMPSWGTAFDGMMQKVDELVQDKILPANDELIDAAQEYQDSLDDLELAAGEDFDSIEEGIDRDIDATQELIENNDDLISKYEDLINKLGDAVNAIDALIDKYNEAREAAIAAAEAAEQFYEAAQGRDVDTSNIHMPTPSVPATPQDTSQTRASTSGGGSGSGSGGGSGSGSGSSGRGSGSGSSEIWTRSAIRIANGPRDAKQHTLEISHSQLKDYKITRTTPGSSDYDYVVSHKTGSGRTVIDGYTDSSHWTATYYQGHGANTKKIKGFRSGGYTGEWNDSEGRLALLHQKELVLNQEDTKNTLKAVKIASGLINSLSGLGSNMLNNLYAGRSLGGLSSGKNGTLEQEVHITAEFPNANSAQEIEKALNNLVNAAAQHASINRRKY